MKSSKYYLTQLGRPLCSNCAEESELESGVPLKERKNDTGDTLECVACDEDIPCAKQKEAK
jgi:hypothetical protein